MPAGQGKRCQECYWKESFDKRLRIAVMGFSTLQIARHFSEFAEWLKIRVGVNKAAITLHKYLAFFMEIEKIWREVPSFNDLLAHFGTAKLRQQLLPTRWLEEVVFRFSDPKAKEEDSDKRRIKSTLGKLPRNSIGQMVLQNYYHFMLQRLACGNTTLRSIRLALTPAIRVLEVANERGIPLPDQAALEAYLAKSPGQRAAVSGFVCYLRDVIKITLDLPKQDQKKANTNQKKRLEVEILLMMQKPESGKRFEKRWISIALAYFHNLPRMVGKNAKPENILRKDSSGITLVFSGNEYWIASVPGMKITQK